MQTSENKFKMVGTVKSIHRVESGNIYINLTVTQPNGRVLKPTVLVPRNVRLSINVGERAYIEGHIYGYDRPKNAERTSGMHVQRFCADMVAFRHEKIGGYAPKEYLDVRLAGTLVRVIDSGHGFFKTVLKTVVLKENEEIPSFVTVSYYGSDRCLIKPSLLRLGSVYEMVVDTSTPEREKNGKKIVFNNLIAIAVREIVDHKEDAEIEIEKTPRMRSVKNIRERKLGDAFSEAV